MTWTTRPRSEIAELAAITQGTGPLILLIHGVGLRSEAWNAQIDVLAERYTVIAIDMPAKAIIGPIDRSNSPAIISSAAPTAIMPSCEMIATLFLRPRALKALPSDAIPNATIIIIITINEPISGRLIMRWSKLSCCKRSASLLSDITSLL